jgi:hypothetical protein
MVTPSRAVVQVTEVLVPCALIPIVLSKVELNSKVERTTTVEHKNKRACKKVIVSTNESEVPPSSSSSSSNPQSNDGDYQWSNIEDKAIANANEDDEEFVEDLTTYKIDSDEDENVKEYLANLADSILKRLNKLSSKVKGDHLHCFKIWVTL